MISRPKFIAAVAVAAALLLGAAPMATAAGVPGYLLLAAAGGDHHDLHIGAPEGEPDPAEFRSDLAIYTFIVFVLLLAILWKFAWGPIVRGLDAREQRIADNIAAAERSHAEAKQLLVQYEERLASAQDEVRAILDEARRDAEHTQQQMLAKAAADAEATMNRAKREIDTAKDQALKELGEHAARLAVELASKIIRAELNGDSHARLIEEAVAKFPQGSPSVN